MFNKYIACFSICLYSSVLPLQFTNIADRQRIAETTSKVQLAIMVLDVGRSLHARSGSRVFEDCLDFIAAGRDQIIMSPQ